MNNILSKIADRIIDIKKSGWIVTRVFISSKDVGKFGYDPGHLEKIDDRWKK